jgi:hypothetical protein
VDIVACDEREPSAGELAAIEAEWPRIEVDLAELDAEIAEATHGVGSGAARWAWQRHRRLARRVLSSVRSVPAVRLGVAA